MYHTVIIGTQVWMVENLKTTKYRDGSAIPNVTDDDTWGSLRTGAYCNFGNDDAIGGTKYGKLYNWDAVNDSRNIAPTGWHVPTMDEWYTLTDYLYANYGTFGSKALASKTDWASSTNANAGAVGNDLTKNNTTGFTALPGGYRNHYGTYNDSGYYGYWWSSSDGGYRYLLYYGSYVGKDFSYYGKVYGYSVRCVKD
ncbi:MAG TPA: fibrobacter succinogenes major paralogous domain-containing protein [Paludibacter sp.]